MGAEDASSLREQLYRVIQHYAELSAMARKGSVDPLAHMGRILQRRFPYLLLVIRDMLPLLARGHVTYYEVLFNIIREAQRFPDFRTIQESKKEIEKIEQEGKAFLFAVKWLDSKNHVRPALEELDRIQGVMMEMNDKYVKRYGHRAASGQPLVPHHISKENEPADITFRRVGELVRRAVHQLFHLMVEHEYNRSLSFIFKGSRKEIEQDILKLAWFLFRCGYSVDWTAKGYYKEQLSAFLNERLLDYLIETREAVAGTQGLSMHLAMISLIDFGSFFELQKDYCSIDDRREVAQQLKILKTKKRRGAEILKKLHTLYKSYESTGHGVQAQRYLGYRYYSSCGSYYGERRPMDSMGPAAVKMYKRLVDKETVEKQTAKEIAESGPAYSSKTKEEMAALVKLIVDSLENPASVRGEKVKVLGEISSGGMGKVSIGIYNNMIVALKTVKADLGETADERVALLKYEAAIHSRVQTSEREPGKVLPPDQQHPSIVEYYGLVEQGGELIMINGYYPNDNLTALVQRNWSARPKSGPDSGPVITMRTFKHIVDQSLECLRHFRQKGVIHRDLKTDNILYMVDETGEANRIKIIDFGAGLAVGSGAEHDHFERKVVGTLSYMPPEQAKGKSLFQSDLYSLGAIFTVLLTGRVPIDVGVPKTRQELTKQLKRIRTEPRAKLATLSPWIRKHPELTPITKIVERMLDLDPLERPSVEQCLLGLDEGFASLGDDMDSMRISYYAD